MNSKTSQTLTPLNTIYNHGKFPLLQYSLTMYARLPCVGSALWKMDGSVHLTKYEVVRLIEVYKRLKPC